MYILSYYDITFHHRAQIIEMIPTWLLFDCYWNEKKKEEKKNRKRVTAKNRISEKLRKKKEKLLYDVSLCIVSSIVMLNSW